MTGEMFLAYVERCSVPVPWRNVVMDNCPIHLGAGIRAAIEKSGATLRYLPKCSPDLNPIEPPDSKLKTFLRNAIERLHKEFKRRIKTQTVLPSADTAAMLFWALLASGQINMRKVDGWQTLATNLIDQPIDLAA